MTPHAPPFLVGDPRPDAPELAPRGPHGVGVRTLALVDPGRFDLTAAAAGAADPHRDRELMVELFYPAQAPADGPPIAYRDHFAWWSTAKSSVDTIRFTGRALRDAEPDDAGTPWPLLVLSHGYFGSRYTLSNLAENLASKGYVVAALGHQDETLPNELVFPGTLLNRPLDQLFALEALTVLNAGDDPLAGRIDPQRSALIGYSMGGYGALNVGGAGLSADFVARSQLPPPAIAPRQAGAVQADPRVRALVALAPWGGPAALAASGVEDLSVWDAEGLAGLAAPTLFIVGSDDDISGYDGGVRWLFEHAGSAERQLLVFRHARHNVGPNPPPPETWACAEAFERYAEPVWSETRINNVNQHFVTAFLGVHLKGLAYRPYLEEPIRGKWLGFDRRSALGLELLRGG